MERIPITRPLMGPEEKAAVGAVLDSGKLHQGERVAEFEDKFRKVSGTDFAIAAGSGTSALLLALRALRLPAGSFVHTSPLTYVSTGSAIVSTGLRLSLSDISLASYNLDDDYVERDLAPGASALLPVHLYGLPSPMDCMLDVAARKSLRIIEDCAQAVGARYKGRLVGSMGDLGCFSFNTMKIITTGEGGMVTTNDERLARAVRVARDIGRKATAYEFEEVSGNFRMSEIEAAIGIEQLKKLSGSIERRRENAAFFAEELKSVKGIVLPMAPPGLEHVWYQYTLRVLNGNRDAMRAHLDRAGIETGVYYAKALQHLGIFEGIRLGRLGRCEMACGEVLSIPVHPGVGGKERERIAQAVRSF
jgi:perosamine synthetase